MQQNKIVLLVMLGGVLFLAIVSGATYFLTRTSVGVKTVPPATVIEPTLVNTESRSTTTVTTPPVVPKKVQTPTTLQSSKVVTPPEVITETGGMMPEMVYTPVPKEAEAPTLTQGDIGTVVMTPTGLTLNPPSPVWATLTFNVTKSFDIISFDYKFAAPAEGLLSVFMDDQVVFKADQRQADNGINHSGPIPVGKVSLGFHSLSFRIDHFTSAQTAVEITNISFFNISIIQVINKKPVAVAGINKNVSVGSLTYLDGSASYDPDKKPLPLTYDWTQISGPDVLLFSPTAINPKFTPSTKGTYVFSLKVNDGQSYSKISTVSVNAL